MKYLWLLVFPLLFLPNLGIGEQTTYGSLEFSDYLIGPFLFLVWWGSRRCGRVNANALVLPMLAFVAWALVSTVSIGLRYPYTNVDPITTFCLLKLGKLAVYALCGYLLSKALGDKTARVFFPWSLLICGCVMAVSLIVLPEGASLVGTIGYKGNNGINVALAMLLCYTGGIWISQTTTKWWRAAAIVSFILMLGGLLMSSRQGGHGRGGWIAAAVGFLYLAYRRGFKREVVLGSTLMGILLFVFYNSLPGFREGIDSIVNPTQDFSTQYNIGFAVVDDGGRVSTWQNELPKLANAPVLGSGFYHRGGESTLWATGSHNFWIQMFLETGLVGGCLVLWMMGLMWDHAGRESAVRARVDVAVKAALVAAIVGGFSGEFFYGSSVLLLLFAFYAPAGCLPLRPRKVPGSSRRQPVEVTS